MIHRIQNLEELATGNAKRLDALAIAEAGYAAINTGEALRRKMWVETDGIHIGGKIYPTAERQVYFVGIGKCAFDAAEAIEDIFGDLLIAGIAFGVGSQEKSQLNKIQPYSGTHPLPSEANVVATRHVMEFLSDRTENDLVIMLISGGGSTLLCSPSGVMTCLDESTLFSELTARGATIQDINTVRKHTSLARGGALAEAAYPAEVLALIASDVPGNDIPSIASGPTVLDSSTIADAEIILAKYSVAAAGITLIETPKDARYFERVTNTLFITSQDALLAMQEEATRRGYQATIVADCFTGEAREVGRSVVEKLHTVNTGSALLYAGESTVMINGDGKGSSTPLGAGGRNQEMSLAALSDIREGELLLPFASDGRDNTDHAGAIADSTTLAHAHEQNLAPEDYLATHRSYDFFTTTRDALLTGYTGSNVSDLIIALKK